MQLNNNFLLGVLLIVAVFVLVIVGVEKVHDEVDDYSYSFGFPTWGDYWGGGGPLKGGVLGRPWWGWRRPYGFRGRPYRWRRPYGYLW